MRIIVIVRKSFAFSIFRLPKQTDLTDSDLCEMPVDDVRPISPATLVAIVNKEDTGEEETMCMSDSKGREHPDLPTELESQLRAYYK